MYGQGIAVDPVFGFEFTLEVSSPDSVGFSDGCCWFSGVSAYTGSSRCFDPAVSFEYTVDGRDCWYGFWRPFLEEEILDLRSSPVPSFLEFEDVTDDFWRSSM